MAKKQKNSPEGDPAPSLPMIHSGLLRADPVLITVSSSSDADEEISLITRGTLASMTNGWGLCFHETGADPHTDYFTYLLCEENSVTISRIGETASTIVHRARETYVNSRETSKGTYSTCIFTHFVRIKRRGRTGQIQVSYQMNGSGAQVPYAGMLSRHLDIRFRPCK